MNFIGEKPLDIVIDGVDIILTPSYKWIIKNLNSFFIDGSKQIGIPYDPNENNSMDIFEKKVNVVDNSIFKKDKILEIFKDNTKISLLINTFFKYCFKFYYMKNFLVNAKIRNIHIRLEDDQLINYNGDIALGLNANSIEINLSSEGIMKKDFFKINNLNVYWENNAKILIPSDLLHDSIIDGKLSQKYYDNLKKLNFKHFNYIEGTKFLVQNFNCLGKIGTISISSGKIDLFGKRENTFKMYVQLTSNELNINLYPELLNIYTNYRKFVQEFNVLEQIQDFKPMRKPYDLTNVEFKGFLKKIQENKNSTLSKLFAYKRKMLVRDWLFYFFWCKKCKSTIYTEPVSPLRIEFTRFYGICFNQWEDLSENELKKLKENKEEEKEEINADNVQLYVTGDLLIKEISVNFHTSVKLPVNKYISLKIGGIAMKINSSFNKFDLNIGIRQINLFPNQVIIGEKYIINSNIRRREQTSTIKTDSNMNSIEQNKFIPLYDIEENTGLVGLVKKYNPNYDQKIKIIDSTLDKISLKSRNESRAVSEIDISEFTPNYKGLKNINNSNQKLQYNSSNKLQNESKEQTLNIKLNNLNHNFIYRHQIPKNNSFAKQLISNYEATPVMQRMELKKQKKEFSISQAINEYNSRKTQERQSIKSLKNGPSSQITGTIFSKNQNLKNDNIPSAQIISSGKIEPLSLMQITNDNNSECFVFKYTKHNNNKNIDNLLIQLGTVRFNLFSDYVETYLCVLHDYKAVLSQPIIQTLNKFNHGIKAQRELYKMKKYIYEHAIKMVGKRKNDQLKEYINYLKKEIDGAKALGVETEHFQINYFMSLFPIGFNLTFDYDIIEFLSYNNDKKVCGKGYIPPAELRFVIDQNIIKVNFFDFEFEINDLKNGKVFLSKIINIFEEKLNMAKLFIQPCMAKLREDQEKKMWLHKTENEKKSKKIENMLLMVQEKLHNKKESKQNDDDIVNYKNLLESKEKENNKINNEFNTYKGQMEYIPTCKENEEEEVNVVENGTLTGAGKISVKESKKTNNFYSHLIGGNEMKIEKINKDSDNLAEEDSKQENERNKVKITFPKKNALKINLPKVGKK